MKQFYGNFAAAYGTCWFALMILATLTMSSIDTGAFGFFGFPIIGVVYALSRRSQNSPFAKRKSLILTTEKPSDEIVRLRQRVAELQNQLSHGNAGPSES